MAEEELLFLNKIQRFLESKGCKVFREVIPDECADWEKPYRVDMIIYKQDFGYIGLEGKSLHTIGQGAIFAKAFEQIKKYRTFHYFKGIKIDRWALLPDFDEFHCPNCECEGTERALIFIRSFFRFYDIYIAEFDEHKEYFSIGKNFPNAITFSKYYNGINNGKPEFN